MAIKVIHSSNIANFIALVAQYVIDSERDDQYALAVPADGSFLSQRRGLDGRGTYHVFKHELRAKADGAVGVADQDRILSMIVCIASVRALPASRLFGVAAR